ncbi:MAG: hypothetical protein SGJ11_16155, partial [Phycisphaerae bacterium]|nr:hypothetical protein [Phycisphaerae bacterium]
MTRRNATKARAIAALTVSISMPTVLTAVASAETIEVGTILQLGPPAIAYSGNYLSSVSSSLVQNPVNRTLVTVDLYAIMQSAGLNYLESVQVLDGAGNSYGGSPGADIDYFQLEGLGAGVTTSFAYTGTNPVHAGESSALLQSRLGAMDAISGDQDWNS